MAKKNDKIDALIFIVQKPVKLTTLGRFKLTTLDRSKLTTLDRSKLTTYEDNKICCN